ncbi:MAG: hypothetical protein NWE89_14370 [Candidatus Bathyarchaeota archaeon]|nr:hypothetical protein [Candidatus Bathyarchaeota archaeon]
MSQRSYIRFKPRRAKCHRCGNGMIQKSGIQKYCASCRRIVRNRRAYLHNIKSGHIQNPGIGRAKPMLRGEGNGNWQGGAIPWQVEHFRGTECERCGSDEDVELHHRDRDRSNWKDGNLETLCFACHRKEHTNEPEHPTKRFYAHGTA